MINKRINNYFLIEKELPPMYTHQQKAVNTTDLTDSALIIRGAGSGKTRIGIEIIKKYISDDKYIFWVCPAALISQTMRDFDEADIPNYKFTSQDPVIEKGKVMFVSYGLLKRNVDLFTSKKWDLIISDEFHRTRNEGTVINEAVWLVRQKAKRFYALTATPFNNTKQDFFEILSIVAGVDVVDKLSKSFSVKEKKSKLLFKFYSFFMKKVFGKEEENKVKAKFTINKRTINKMIDSFIDYVEPEEYLKNISRPSANSKIEHVEMFDDEVEEYKQVLKTKKIRNKEMFFRTFLLREDSSKIAHVTAHVKKLLKKENPKIIVFSNFVDNGLGSLATKLDKAGVEYEIFKGSTTKQDKSKIREAFTSGDLKVLLISPSGFEGLNLKGATDCIVLDPHYNPAKTEQIISRGLRAGSKIKVVNIFHYCSVSSKLKVPTVDEKIMKTSSKKEEINSAMEELLKQVKEKKEK